MNITLFIIIYILIIYVIHLKKIGIVNRTIYFKKFEYIKCLIPYYLKDY